MATGGGADFGGRTPGPPREWQDLQRDHLATVCTVVQEGGFSAAARRLHLSQPAVSQQVRAVEEALGCRLIERGRRPLALTEAGRRVYPQLEACVAAYRQAQALARRSGAGAAELRLSAVFTVGEHLLPRLLGEFRLRCPSALVSITVGDCRCVLRSLVDGGADLGVTFLLPGEPDVPRSLRVVDLWEERLHLVVARTHPWAGRGPLSLADIEGGEFILRDIGSATRRIVDAALDTSRLRVTMEVGTNEAVRAAVRAGLGAGFVSELALEADLAPVRVEGLSVSRRLVALVPQRPAPQAPARTFLALLRAQAARTA
jgi:DNA-binding transcriptional LysR family regulator